MRFNGRLQLITLLAPLLSTLFAIENVDVVQAFQTASSSFSRVYTGSTTTTTTTSRTGIRNKRRNQLKILYGFRIGADNEAKDESSKRVFDGYSSVEQNVLSSGSPAAKLMEEYMERTDDSSTVENEYSSDDDRKSEENNWNSFKDTFYGTVDGVSSLLQGSDEDIDKMTISGMTSANAADNDFKPLVQTQLKQWEGKKRKMERKVKRNQAFENVKNTIYGFIDGIDNTIETVSQIPDKAKQVSKDISNLPSKVKLVAKETKMKVDMAKTTINDAVETVSNIPNKVQETIDETVETTQKVISDVQAVPDKVEQKIVATKKTLVEIKDGVDETTTKFKVLTGLEKPKPKPPATPPPPPKKSAKEIGMQVAGTVASGVGKASWWVGKQTTIAFFKGSVALGGKVVETIKEKSSGAKETNSGVEEIVPTEKIEVKKVAPISTSSIGGSASSKKDSKSNSSSSKSWSIPFSKLKNEVPIPSKKEKPKKLFAPFSTVQPTTKTKAKAPAITTKPKKVTVNREVEDALKLAEDALNLVEKDNEDATLSELVQSLDEEKKKRLQG